MVNSSQREQVIIVSSIVCLLQQLLWKTRYARRSVDQSDGIYNSYSTVARELWQHKQPLSSGYALGLESVYCHKSLAPCYNYNITNKLQQYKSGQIVQFFLGIR